MKNITVKIDVKIKNTKRKATFAIRELKRQIQKHFKNKEFTIDNELNNFIWDEGKKNAPSKITITAIEEKNKLKIFLANGKNIEEYLKKQKEKESKTKKKTTKKENTKEEEKVKENEVQKV